MSSPIESLTTLKKVSSQKGWFRNRSVVYNGLGPLGAHMFKHFLPIAAVIAEYYGEEVQKHIESDWGTPVFSYEKNKRVRHSTSSLFINYFYQDHEREILAALDRVEGEIFMIPFQPSQTLLDFVFKKAPRLQFFQNTCVIQDYFEDKTLLAWKAEEIGIPLPAQAMLSPFSNVSHQKLIQQFPEGYVIQVPHSQHGGGTDFIFSEGDYQKVIEEKRNMLGKSFDRTTVKITPFLSGPSLNCTGCVVNGTVAVSPPDIQIVGDPRLVTNPAMYIGSDFSRQGLTSGEREEVFEIIKKIGLWLGSNGYRGNFGVDFLTTVDEKFKLKEIFVSEINARLVGESQYMADFEAMKDIVPLTFFHLAEYLELDVKAEDIDAYNDELPDVEGSAVIIYSKDKGTFRATGGITSGVYRFEGERLIRLRDGWTLSDTQNEDEFVLTNGVPWDDLVIGHPRYGDEGIPLIYIMTRKSIVDPINWRILSGEWLKNVELVRDALKLEPCPYRSLAEG